MPATAEGGGPNCGKRRSMRRRKDKGKRDGGRSGARGGVQQKREHGKEKKCGGVIRTISQKNFKKHIKTLEKTGKLC